MKIWYFWWKKDGYYIHIYKVENNVHQVHQPSNNGFGDVLGELTLTKFLHRVAQLLY